uniref:Uncharacterized protein n=1 Tax=Geospiza parvula TaxID=87175 RepID=A0A8U8C3T2_GEOPR
SPVSPGATEDECLEFYGMLSLRRLFEVLAAQLTHGEAAVLSFLLDEAGGAAPRGRREPRDALELLLELERRGLCHEGDLGQLRQLLRLLARHDLLRCVTLKRPRVPLSPCPSVPLSLCPPSLTAVPLSPQCPPSVPPVSLPWGAPAQAPPSPAPSTGRQVRNLGTPWGGHLGVSLGSWSDFGHPPARAEYCEHERALRRGVASSRPRGPGRALDVFGQASGVLKARDLGSILCDIKFSELSYLEAFWGDYLSGALLEALKGDVRLLVSVDQDDYEAGRRLLMGGGRGGVAPRSA